MTLLSSLGGDALLGDVQRMDKRQVTSFIPHNNSKTIKNVSVIFLQLKKIDDVYFL